LDQKDNQKWKPKKSIDIITYCTLLAHVNMLLVIDIGYTDNAVLIERKRKSYWCKSNSSILYNVLMHFMEIT
jgi:hypothetical protein